ncbi:glycosyltransferase family 4 protein [Magnetococcus sp. PR-3]|uniref:glycosyltransferase family 4 protein n=1 Tax=Magnetococcus sp. PR-3 TaxID=3120355 RepID=UPI002FCE42D3
MPNNTCLLFIQQRPNKGGAQTCLARLLGQPRLQARNPIVVTASTGWFTEQCDRMGVTHFQVPFPRSRALKGRLWQNRQFARTVHQALQQKQRHPLWVHGNDHWEGLLTQATAKQCHAKSALFLRSPGMTQRDYVKYHCQWPDLVSVVGDELHARACGWDQNRPFALIHDGIDPVEFLPLKAKAPAFPKRILVIGSHLDWKGWADLTDAVFQLEQNGLDPTVEFHFTGHAPDPASNDLKLERHQEKRFQFLGFTDAFQERVLRYDLVINPSRQESFGMAALEVIAAGVPLLSSRSGIIEQVIEDERFLFKTHDSQDFARALRQLMENWPAWESDWKAAQARILARFSVDQTVDKLLKAYQSFE